MIPDLVPGFPAPSGCMQWFIQTLKMFLCVWIENADKGLYVRTCFAVPNNKGELYTVPFFGSFKETSVSRGNADVTQSLLLEQSIYGTRLAMEINMKKHGDIQYKVWFIFKFHSSDGFIHLLDVTSTSTGIHYVSKVVSEKMGDLEENNTEEGEAEDEEDEDEENEAENEEVEDEEDESEDNGDDDTYGVSKIVKNIVDDQDVKAYTCGRTCVCPRFDEDDKEDFVPPPKPPSHILKSGTECRKGRWRKPQTQMTFWDERDHQNLRNFLIDLREEMHIKCNSSFDISCAHLIWRYFSQKALEGTMHFLPSHTMCCKHSGSQLWSVSQTIDTWFIHHQHDSYEDFIESTCVFFRSKKML